MEKTTLIANAGASSNFSHSCQVFGADQRITASENEIEIQAVVVYIQNPQDRSIWFIMLCVVLS